LNPIFVPWWILRGINCFGGNHHTLFFHLKRLLDRALPGATETVRKDMLFYHFIDELP
uniref:Uncharacterized protein n=1 Tax=Amphimedon queenslandica TaxID=400682 RepID=A0A1X7T2H3_AMPQE